MTTTSTTTIKSSTTTTSTTTTSKRTTTIFGFLPYRLTTVQSSLASLTHSTTLALKSTSLKSTTEIGKETSQETTPPPKTTPPPRTTPPQTTPGQTTAGPGYCENTLESCPVCDPSAQPARVVLRNKRQGAVTTIASGTTKRFGVLPYRLVKTTTPAATGYLPYLLTKTTTTQPTGYLPYLLTKSTTASMVTTKATAPGTTGAFTPTKIQGSV